MLLGDIIPPSQGEGLNIIRNTIKLHCSDFISESRGIPLYKALKRDVGEFKRIKVRQKKKDHIGSIFEAATNIFAIRERALIANGKSAIVESDDETLYYVFPVNGYSYLYSKDIKDSSELYTTTYESIKKGLGVDARDITTDLVKLSYKHDALVEGLKTQCEMLFYSVPAYYAVSTNLVPDYKQII